MMRWSILSLLVILSSMTLTASSDDLPEFVGSWEDMPEVRLQAICTDYSGYSYFRVINEEPNPITLDFWSYFPVYDDDFLVGYQYQETFSVPANSNAIVDTIGAMGNIVYEGKYRYGWRLHPPFNSCFGNPPLEASSVETTTTTFACIDIIRTDLAGEEYVIQWENEHGSTGEVVRGIVSEYGNISLILGERTPLTTFRVLVYDDSVYETVCQTP